MRRTDQRTQSYFFTRNSSSWRVASGRFSSSFSCRRRRASTSACSGKAATQDAMAAFMAASTSVTLALHCSRWSSWSCGPRVRAPWPSRAIRPRHSSSFMRTQKSSSRRRLLATYLQHTRNPQRSSSGSTRRNRQGCGNHCSRKRRVFTSLNCGFASRMSRYLRNWFRMFSSTEKYRESSWPFLISPSMSSSWAESTSSRFLTTRNRSLTARRSTGAAASHSGNISPTALATTSAPFSNMSITASMDCFFWATARSKDEDMF
ncbi:hypothetical protein EYF80_049694 [Liparis tanakae]|uniref:Uncharacterized protein n=1 Tax=Liparis tanakae TaxID=230148 RepID=A0A4Z2FGV5_9TELE|nr:hypothetical protein EYF80_049694 [Liparis tanakae]